MTHLVVFLTIFVILAQKATLGDSPYGSQQVIASYLFQIGDDKDQNHTPTSTSETNATNTEEPSEDSAILFHFPDRVYPPIMKVYPVLVDKLLHPPPLDLIIPPNRN